MSRLQYADRMRNHRDMVVKFMNSYIKFCVDGLIDPMQIYFAKNELTIAKVWLELNEPLMPVKEYWVYDKYLDLLDTYIFKEIARGRRMQREKVN